MGNFTLTVLDNLGNAIFHGKLQSLPLSEETIIKKSLELFNDDEPCIIHRSYVMKRLYIEIEDYFRDSCREGSYKISCHNISHNILKMINIGKDAHEILIS